MRGAPCDAEFVNNTTRSALSQTAACQSRSLSPPPPYSPPTHPGDSGGVLRNDTPRNSKLEHPSFR